MYVTGLARLFSNGVAGVANTLSQLDDNNNNIPIVARVTDVCLNSNSELFNESGWSSIGTISFQNLGSQSPTYTQNKTAESTALPLIPQYKNYPLVNEFVIVFKGAGTDNPQTSNISKYFYLPLNIWNSQHFNGYPAPFTPSPESQNSEYSQVEIGNSQVSETTTQQLNVNGKSGGNFVEKGNVHPILPFAGDNIIEGRNGNSIRLGSTSTSKGEIQNNWSEGSSEGDPITILKNGQPSSISPEGYIPITEDINTDPASVYLTSKQQIPIDIATATLVAGEKSTIPYSSIIDKTPISPKSYNDSQIILNSNRLLFNTIGDNILMSSQKSIVLESREDLGIKSMFKNVNILAPEGNISLGKRNADQSAILGDNFMEYFVSIVKNLNTLVKALKNEPKLTVSKIPANVLSNELLDFLNNIDKTLSDKIKLS